MARPHLPVTLRRRVIERARKRCEYCHLPDGWVTLAHHVDHILPLRHGGATTEDNLAYACFDCNLDKGTNIAALDPLDGQLTRLFNPRLDLWHLHFTLEDGIIIGVNAIGRTTVQLLRFNREARLRQRHLLIVANVYELE
jgi:HNH endonuclease